MSKRKKLPPRPPANGKPAARRTAAPASSSSRTGQQPGRSGKPPGADSGPVRRARRRAPAEGGAYWIYGAHAVGAALANPRRRILRLLHTGETAPAVDSLLAAARSGGTDAGKAEPVAVERVDRALLDRLLPDGAVHQGLAARVEPLPPVAIEDICAAAGDDATVLLLDQVTDPHNVGAILRSAAAFGALAVVLTERNAAPESGALAKAASGALEHVPLVRVTNLARAMETLKDAGFWCIGLAAEATETLATANLSGRVALVLGSEGGGLRRLTRDRCDLLVRLPTGGPIADLNVSNAAAVALYERARNRQDERGVDPMRPKSG